MQAILLIILMKIVFVRGISCDEVLELPQDKKISLSELETIQAPDLVKCLTHLGKEELPSPEANFIWQSIINFYNGIQNIPDSVLMSLHWITVAVSPKDYDNMTLSNIDIIQNFGLNYNLNEEQIAAIAARVREDFAGKEPEDYTYYDLTGLRQILCAFNRSEIERIRPLAYREAAFLIGKLERCNAEAMSGFATLAVQKQAFGALESWTDSTIKIVEWIDDDEVEGSFEDKEEEDVAIPIMDISTHLQNPWTFDK